MLNPNVGYKPIDPKVKHRVAEVVVLGLSRSLHVRACARRANDVRISYVRATTPSPLYRNAIGDECLYIEGGRGTLNTVFGSIPVSAGDLVVVPAPPSTVGCPSTWLTRVLFASSASRPTAISRRRRVTFRGTGSYSSTPLTRSAIFMDRLTRSSRMAARSRSTQSTAGRARNLSREASSPSPATRSMWLAGRAACTRSG